MASHELEQAPGVGDGQGDLVCSSPWGRRQSDMTERLSSNPLSGLALLVLPPFSSFLAPLILAALPLIIPGSHLPFGAQGRSGRLESCKRLLESTKRLLCPVIQQGPLSFH